LTNCAPLLVIACGVTFVVLNGGIDFSATSVLTLGSVFGAYIMVKSPLADSFWGIVVAIVAILMIGVVMGAFNGFSLVILKMPSFIATLATMMIGSGIAVWFASIAYDTASLTGLPDSFLTLGGAKDHFLIPIIIAIVVLVFTHWLLSYTIFGRRVYSVGTNPNTSFISGIPVKKTIFMMCFLSGIYAAVASVMYTAKNEAGIPTLGDKLFIDIIGSIIIGGTSIAGGSGGVKQTLYGVLFIMLIDNVMNLLGVTWYVISLIKGILILAAAFIDMFTKQANRYRVKKTLESKESVGA
jgi:ribose transport system permease protein